MLRYLSEAKTISQERQIEILIIVCVLFLVFCMIVKLVGSLVSPVLGELAEAESVSTATRAVTKAAAEFLASNPMDYEKAVTVTRASDGSVVSLETNTAVINSFSDSMVEYIIGFVKKNDSVSVKIPLGSLMKNPLLSGKGPSVRVRASVIGSVVASPESTFTSAGINQSCHRITVNVCLKYRLVLPNGMRDAEVTVPVCIAETVIVGDVPNYLR